MKQLVSKKSIISAMVLMLMMVVCSNANAQVQNRVINNFSDIEDNAKCWAYLKVNKTDTLRQVVTILCEEEGELDDPDHTHVSVGDYLTRTISVFMENGAPTRVRHYQKNVAKQVTCLDPKLACKIDTACVETRYAADIKTNPRLRYDFRYGQVDANTRQYLTTDGKFVESFGRKDGLNLAVLGAYQTGNDISSITAKGGVMYFGGSALTNFRYLVPVTVGATRTKYSDLAENYAGDEYWSFTSETGFYWQPFTFDRMDQLRWFVGGGVAFNWYQTDVQTHKEGTTIHKISSWGSSITGVLGTYLTYRPKCSRWNLMVGVKGYQSPEIRLNQDTRRPWVLSFELGASYNLGEGFGNFKK